MAKRHSNSTYRLPSVLITSKCRILGQSDNRETGQPQPVGLKHANSGSRANPNLGVKEKKPEA